MGILLKAQTILVQLVKIVLFEAKRYIFLCAEVFCMLKFYTFFHFVNVYEGWRCGEL